MEGTLVITAMFVDGTMVLELGSEALSVADSRWVRDSAADTSRSVIGFLINTAMMDAQQLLKFADGDRPS